MLGASRMSLAVCFPGIGWRAQRRVSNHACYLVCPEIPTVTIRRMWVLALHHWAYELCWKHRPGRKGLLFHTMSKCSTKASHLVGGPRLWSGLERGWANQVFPKSTERVWVTLYITTSRTGRGLSQNGNVKSAPGTKLKLRLLSEQFTNRYMESSHTARPWEAEGTWACPIHINGTSFTS